MLNKFEYVSWSERKFDLPKRSTTKSAGYDFRSPIAFKLNPGETKEVDLEVKVSITENEFLLIVPRSSLGFKNGNHLMLTNTTGIIDSDYYNNKSNEGDIKLRLHNFGENVFECNVNDKLVQGIFLRYDLVENEDEIKSERSGGFGSTDK